MVNYDTDCPLGRLNLLAVRNDKLRAVILDCREESKKFAFNYSDYNDYTVNYTVAQK